jgi:hypothetical protein
MYGYYIMRFESNMCVLSQDIHIFLTFHATPGALDGVREMIFCLRRFDFANWWLSVCCYLPEYAPLDSR